MKKNAAAAADLSTTVTVYVDCFFKCWLVERETYSFSSKTANEWHPLLVLMLGILVQEASRGSNRSADLSIIVKHSTP